jgi:hypothetical protein
MQTHRSSLLCFVDCERPTLLLLAAATRCDEKPVA